MDSTEEPKPYDLPESAKAKPDPRINPDVPADEPLKPFSVEDEVAPVVTEQSPELPAAPIPTFPSPLMNPTLPVIVSSKASITQKLPLLVLVLVLLLGGSAAAYFGYILPSQPNNVIMKSLANLAAKNGVGGYQVTIDTKSNSGEVSPSTSITVAGSLDKDNNVRIDMSVGVSAFKLTASSIIRPNDKELFLKINELPSLLTLMGNESPELNALASKLDENWIHINTAGLEEAGAIDHKQALSANSCIDALKSYFKDSRATVQNQLTTAYKQNMFLDATKLGTEDVSGTAATRYKLDVDQAKAKQFFTRLAELDDPAEKPVNEACGISEEESSSTDDIDKAIDEIKLENVHAWVGPGKKLLKLSADTVSNGTTIQMAILFNDKLLDASAPKNIVGIKELRETYGNLLPGEDSLETFTTPGLLSF